MSRRPSRKRRHRNLSDEPPTSPVSRRAARRIFGNFEEFQRSGSMRKPIDVILPVFPHPEIEKFLSVFHLYDDNEGLINVAEYFLHVSLLIVEGHRNRGPDLRADEVVHVICEPLRTAIFSTRPFDLTFDPSDVKVTGRGSSRMIVLPSRSELPQSLSEGLTSLKRSLPNGLFSKGRMFAPHVTLSKEKYNKDHFAKMTRRISDGFFVGQPIFTVRFDRVYVTAPASGQQVVSVLLERPRLPDPPEGFVRFIPIVDPQRTSDEGLQEKSNVRERNSREFSPRQLRESARKAFAIVRLLEEGEDEEDGE